jgi:DNA polymerase (family 10)
VVDAFNQVSFAAELLGDATLGSPRDWGQAAWALRSLDGDFQEAWDSGAVAKVPGMSDEMLEVARQVMAGEEVALIASLQTQVPAGLFEVRRIKGLGAKKIKALWEGLEITTLAELEYACNENRLVELKGFGAKTQEKVLASIAELRRTAGHLRLDQMRELASPLRAALAAAYEEVRVTGALARGRETMDVCELVVVDGEEDPVAAEAALVEQGAEDIVVDDAGDIVVVEGKLGETRVVVSVIGELARLGAASVMLSSSPGYRARLLERAESRGVDLDVSGADACPEEVHLYDELGLAFTPAERREDACPLVEAGQPHRLIEPGDLQGALHNHTTASDGVNSLVEMRDAAAERGLTYLGITDHSVTASYAGGLDAKRLLDQAAEVTRLNDDDSGCALLHGVESDILRDGALDYDDEVLGALDLVVASVHARHGQGKDEMTARMVRAAEHGLVDVIGHPTGRLLLGRAPTELDIEALLDACKRAGAAIELNANPARLDLNEAHLALAKERGVLVSIAADAHSVRALDHLAYGVTIARRAGLGPDDVLNTRSAPEIRAWLVERRA